MVEFGDEFQFQPDVSMETVRTFVKAARMDFWRFTDHERARSEGGLPGAIVPGIMSQGILAAAIHRFVPGGTLRKVDTVFRAPVIVDSTPLAKGVVTHVDEDEGVAEFDLTLENEAGETRVLGTAVVSLPHTGERGDE
jgi:acyl dehydratase